MTQPNTVTVFVRVMPGAFPRSVESDVRVYGDDVPAEAVMTFCDTGWIQFSEVPVQRAAEAFKYLDKLNDRGDMIR